MSAADVPADAPPGLAAALAEVNGALRAHAGGLELISVEDGTVRVRFIGACTGCPARPVTLTATVQPGLAAAGIRHVVVDGVRLDADQQARLNTWLSRR